MLNLDPAVAELQANWHLLPDFERAQAVLPIIRAGMSRRHLAIALNVSEGTIRNLLMILQADPDELASFRRGEISQNDVLRRVRADVSAAGRIERRLYPDGLLSSSAN